MAVIESLVNALFNALLPPMPVQRCRKCRREVGLWGYCYFCPTIPYDRRGPKGYVKGYVKPEPVKKDLKLKKSDII